MSEKKNIDRLFQEKFQDFEFAPPGGAWENIRERLEEKKKRRVIPLWLRLTGVAALLLIGFGLFGTFTRDFTTNDAPLVLDGAAKVPGKSGNIPSPDGRRIRSNQTVADSDNGAGATTGTAVATGSAGYDAGGGALNKNKVQTGKGRNSSALTGASAAQAVAEGSSNAPRKTGNGYRKHKRGSRNTIAMPEGVAYQQQPAAERIGNAGGNNRKGAQNGTPGSDGPDSRAVTAVAGTDTNGSTSPRSTDSGIGQDSNSINRELPVLQDKKGDAVAEAAVDTTTTPSPENELEKLLQEKLNGGEKDKQQVADAPLTRWALKPQVAPVYYNSFSNGSPIDSEFANNSKTYNNNMSYGLGINYAVNNRLRIRSGVNTVDLSYSTNGIEFFASLTDQTSNVSTSKNANIVVQNTKSPSSITLLQDQLPQQKFNGAMVQKMGYIEVPLEISYALLDKKFGIELIGGMSTLFLNDNNVYVTSTHGYNVEVGEAENLNDIHFSTNVGVGFKYRFWKSFEANFEPTFKYQVNTFSGDTGNFKPYFIGLYSGISFSF